MSEINYQNFDLTIEKVGEEYRVRVDSPSGQAVGTFEVPFSEMEIENFTLTTTPGRRSVRRVDTPEVASAKKFGERLFKAVFTGEIMGRFQTALNDAYHSDSRVRVRLRLTDVPDLAELPWEYLYNPPLNRFLALDNDTALVRYLELPERVRPVTVQLPLRVLVVISDASDYPALDVAQEWANLQESLGGLQREGLVVLDLLEDATLAALRRQLAQQEYNIFHFIGHGGFSREAEEGVLVLKEDNGRGRLVSGQQLGWLLHNHKSLALAVLNACEGARGDRTDVFAGTAQSLVQQGIPAVVAMQREITDDAAKVFAQAFYSSIAHGHPVEAAVTDTRLAIFAEGHGLEWATPVLYLRAADGRIFNLLAPPPMPNSAEPVEEKLEAAPSEPVSEPELVPELPVEVTSQPVRGEASSADMLSGFSHDVVTNAETLARSATQNATSVAAGKLLEQSTRVSPPRAESAVPAQKAAGSTRSFNWLILLPVAVALVAAAVWLASSLGGGTPGQGNNSAAATATVGVPAAVASPTAEVSVADVSLTPVTLRRGEPLNLPSDWPSYTYPDGLRISPDNNYAAALSYIDSNEATGNLGGLAIWSTDVAPSSVITVERYNPTRPLMAFFPGTLGGDGSYDIAFITEETVEIRSTTDPEARSTISVPGILSMDVSDDGRYIVTGSSNGFVYIWSPETGEQVLEIVSHTGHVESVAFSPNETLLATTETGFTQVWDGPSDHLLYEISHSIDDDEGNMRTLFSPDGNTLAICAGASECGLWDAHDGSLISEPSSELEKNDDLGMLRAIAFSEDSSVFVTGWQNGSLQFWKDDAPAGTMIMRLRDRQVSALAFDSALYEMLVGFDSHELERWSTP